MLRLAEKAFAPARIPFKILHVNTRWKFREMIEFRDRLVKQMGLDFHEWINPDGVREDINPFTHGTQRHTHVMKTEGLKQALNHFQFDAAFGGARRDEEKSRAKERVFIFSRPQCAACWDPKNQRPELWNAVQLLVSRKGESIRVFPISNWTELDVWTLHPRANIADRAALLRRKRPVVSRGGTLIMVDDETLPLEPNGRAAARSSVVRFRTLGCYPLTGAIESEADDAAVDHRWMMLAARGLRALEGRLIDFTTKRRLDGEEEAGGLLLMGVLRADGPAPSAIRRLDAWLARTDRQALLRCMTCGSVDDGKSTLIGRLLYDSARGCSTTSSPRSEQGRPTTRYGTTGGEDRLLALLVDGPAGRARAGHHHRRRLPLLFDRRSASSSSPTRRAMSNTRATWRPAHRTADLAIMLIDARHGVLEQTRRTFVPLCAAGHPALRAWRSTRWTWSAGANSASRRSATPTRRVRDAAAGPRHPLHPDVGAQGRERRAPLRQHAVVPGLAAARPPRDGARRQRPQPGRPALPGAARAAAEPRFPRLLRHHRLGRAAPGRHRRRGAERQADPHQGDPPRRCDRVRGIRADVGHGDFDRRGRRQPRRHAGRPQQRAAARQRGRGDGGLVPRAAAAGRQAVPGQAHHPPDLGRGHRPALPDQHRHAAPRDHRAAADERDRPASGSRPRGRWPPTPTPRIAPPAHSS